VKNKYLIFRTDRLGDFLISAILIKCIKENDPNAHITIIASKLNSSFIKTFPYVDNVIELKNRLSDKIVLFFKLRKFLFKNIIIHDNKKRSKIISFFLKYDKKILISDFLNLSQIEIIKKILKELNFYYSTNSLNFLEHETKLFQNNEKIIQIHFDEKWIYKDYIKKYKKIEPNKDEFLLMLDKIQTYKNLKMIITTGHKSPEIINAVKQELNKRKIKLYNDLSFYDLTKITLKSNILISCHGAISHVASANNIKQVDIIDKSYNYRRWSSHFRNYQFVYREEFNILTNNIIKKL
tara:strand:+ start:381 stop:1265 length:885 start_codon:yes stop_codon:yes gene_type:complete